jgi:polyhydroxyalkanoate synthesis regulator phasin
LARIVEVGNELLPTLNDADRLTLQNSMDELCDKMNLVADAAKSKIDDLVQNIQHYRKTAQKIEQVILPEAFS